MAARGRCARACEAVGGRRRRRTSALRVDLAWPEARVVLEVDGFAHHHGPRQLSADHERRSVLTSLGWSVLTTTVAEVRRGERASWRRFGRSA